LSLKRETEERQSLEERLRQSQKMEAIGTLAGGIAHDFNNILAGIIGFTEMVEEDLPEDSHLREYVRRILKASLRGRDLVKQILTFSRKAEHVKVPIPLSPVINETCNLLRASLPATIEIVLDVRCLGSGQGFRGRVAADPHEPCHQCRARDDGGGRDPQHLSG
jgi:signal transduction histidine kinase